MRAVVIDVLGAFGVTAGAVGMLTGAALWIDAARRRRLRRRQYRNR